MEIELNLRHRCIESAIKKEYNQAMSDYFKRSGHSILEEKIDLCKRALETLDFKNLRVTYSELCSGADAEVILFTDSLQNINISINQLKIMI
ncbi:MAG: hypothetical protein GY714_07680 [Desulfobacterales bacterium]|nr:hypothetical protein [Desulfobacterales bacterium]MCP4161404.1 hypothetical protein [Deltaproteobacteria bacterium]